LAAIAIALLAAVGSLVWCFTLTSKLSTAQAELADSKQQDTQMAAELRETNARLKVATDELGKSVGLTQKELDERAQEPSSSARRRMKPPRSRRRSRSTEFPPT
jgi:predicted  nucleic acid-binding Zn-ribbon protein